MSVLTARRLIRLDLDASDESYAKVNDYPSPGGLFEDELLPNKTVPRSLTVCSFDPNAGDGDEIARICYSCHQGFLPNILSRKIFCGPAPAKYDSR